MQVAILYNSLSAKGKGKKIAQTVADYCNENNISFQLYENNWADSVLKAAQIALIGGDGTFNYFLNRFPKTEIPIVLFPGGTGNDLYWKLYNDAPIKSQLKLLGNNNTVIEMDIAECLLDNSIKKHFANGVGLGFDGAVLESMNTVRFFGGFLGYYLVVLKNIFGFKEPHYTMQIDKQAAHSVQPLTIVNIANSSRTGGGFLISPHADIFDLKLNLLHCYVPSIWQRLTLFLKVSSGKHIKSKAITYLEIDTVSFKSNSSIKAQLDGELIESSTFKIGLSEWRLKLAT